MFITLVLIAILAFLLTLRLLKWYLVDLKCLPPGPLPLPFYGNLIPKDVHPGLRRWHEALRREYGDVFTVHQGTVPTVIVNGYKAVMEVLQPANREMVVQMRAKGFGILSLLHEGKGLVWNDASFKQLRKISAESLKAYGEQLSGPAAGTDASGSTKLQEWLDSLREGSSEIDLTAPMRELASNNICGMLFGHVDNRVDEDRFKKAVRLHYQSLMTTNSILLEMVQHSPMLKNLPLFSRVWANFNNDRSQLQSFIAEEMREHMTKMEFSDTSNFLDIFIRSQSKSSLTDRDCQATVMQLMLAGLDAVHTTLMWLFLYCVKHPSIQHKMYKELHGLSGSGLLTGSTLCSTLPYCNAVINEVLRISNVAFTTLPYQSVSEMVVGGHRLPPNCPVVINLTSVHKDPTLYPEPNKFKPERFLDQEGKLCKLKHFMPFSIGRRACIGESFTRKTIVEVLSHLLQRFSVEPVPGEEYSTEPCSSFLSIPQPYRVNLTPK